MMMFMKALFHGVQRWSVLVSCLIILHWQGGFCDEGVEDDSKGQVPSELVERLRSVLSEKFPDVEFRVEDAPAFRSVRLKFKCQEYFLHHIKGLSRTDGFTKSSTESGPSAEGFLLRVDWRQKVGGGQGLPAPPLYWNHISNIYTLPDQGGYLVMSLDIGSRTNVSVLEVVDAELQKFGKPSYDFSATKIKWADASEKLRMALVEVLEKHNVQAHWRTEGDIVIGEVNTLEFDIHSVSSDGEVSSPSHKEIGPDRNGFVIRLSPEASLPRGRARHDFSIEQTAYWSKYSAVCNPDGQSIRLDVMFGSGSDGKLLKALIERMQGRTRVFL